MTATSLMNEDVPAEISDLDCLRKAIRDFAKEHSERPFGVLREIGVQAALKRLADQHLCSHATVDAEVVDHSGQSRNRPEIVNTDRVRLESRILWCREAAEEVDLKPSRDRTDLLLYKRTGIRLVRHGGPGDIVYRSFAGDVLAAVEIKADPSHTAVQKRGYGRDIARLLKLREAGIHGFFMLLDKSSLFYGEHSEKLNCIEWEPGLGVVSRLSDVLRCGSKSRAEYSEWDDILISNELPSVLHIEIHNISTRDTAQRLYYAYKAR